MIPFEDGTIAARDAHGACSFLDGGSGLCSIHRADGVHALPITCRMFPRVVLHDARGTFISLSHFCPTAASLLFESTGDPIAIVEAPAALADIGVLDGLDARREWPPLLRPGVLMDPGSYGAWERRALSRLTCDELTPAAALDALDETTARIASWTPGSGELLDTVHASFDALGADAPDTSRDRAAVKRWLAARLFGAWILYQGNGLAATIAYLRVCLATFEQEAAVDGSVLEAIRRSDLKIVHG